jgi:hypothetical protein
MTSEKKSNHRVNVVRLGEPRVHTNADTLELFDIEGYQVVTKKGQFKAGDLAVYIQPDSVVPQTEAFRFIWEPNALEAGPRYEDENGDFHYEPVSERRRRITVRKFRKEWSEGLIMPVTDFLREFRQFVQRSVEGEAVPGLTGTNTGASLTIPVGTDVSDILGITHYDPDKDAENTGGDNERAPGRKYPRSLRGWIYFLLHKIGFRSAGRQLNEENSLDIPKFDVEAFKNYKNAFIVGEQVLVTEKIHGSQGRYVFFDGHMYAGSRNFWKSSKSNCVWRKALVQNPWIEEWCRTHEGWTLYGEVVPTQKGFSYGTADGQVNFFVFDIRTPNGAYESPHTSSFYGLPIDNVVPLVAHGAYAPDLVKEADGPSFVPGANHIREGVVIRPFNERHVRGLGRLMLKVVSNAFLEKDSK